MAFIAISDVVQLNLRYSYFGQLAENTFYFAADGGVTLSLMNDLADAIHAWCVDDWMPVLSDSLFLNSIYLRDLTEADSFVIDYPLTPPLAGGRTAPGLPGGTSWAVKRRSDFAGRSRRGRIFVTGITEDAVVGNQVTSGWGAAVIAALEESIVVAASAGFVSVIASRISTGGLTPHGTYTIMTGWSAVDFNVDSQRRRLAGRGA